MRLHIKYSRAAIMAKCAVAAALMLQGASLLASDGIEPVTRVPLSPLVWMAGGFFVLCGLLISGIHSLLDHSILLVPATLAETSSSSAASNRRRRMGASHWAKMIIGRWFGEGVAHGGRRQLSLRPRRSWAAIVPTCSAAIAALLLQSAPSLAGDSGKPATPPPPPKPVEASLLSFADGRIVFDLRSGCVLNGGITTATSIAPLMTTTTTPGSSIAFAWAWQSSP